MENLVKACYSFIHHVEEDRDHRSQKPVVHEPVDLRVSDVPTFPLVCPSLHSTLIENASHDAKKMLRSGNFMLARRSTNLVAGSLCGELQTLAKCFGSNAEPSRSQVGVNAGREMRGEP